MHRVFHKPENTGEEATTIHERNLAATEQNVAATEQNKQNVAGTERKVAAAEQDVADIKHNVAASKCTVAVTEHDTPNANCNTTSMPVSSCLQSPETSKTETVCSSRQRSSDSLTLSSSISDSEVTSSEGTSCSGEQTKAKASSAGAGKKSKKQAKKSKKSQKSQPPGKPSKERSEKSLRRRAHVIQRIRNDSWNTSSDEDNSLTLLTESSSAETAFPGVAEERRGEAIDVKIVKADLQKRILSKKPPAQFETPDTEPIYHEVRTIQQIPHVSRFYCKTA